MWEWLTTGAPFTVVLAAVASLSATIHILLNKRYARSAVGWVGVVWLSPGIGVVLYVMFGINRIQRRASRLALEDRHEPEGAPVLEPEPFTQLARLIGQVSHRPLARGNRIELLLDGDEAYPAMLEAIEGATSSVALCTYIFDVDAAGERFIEALARAADRGVQVKVLVDGLGARYSFPRNALRRLRRRGVDARPFLWSLRRLPTLNLRNHRKLMVVDGQIGFTGGMNIRAAHVLGDDPRTPTRDVMVRLRGPVVGDLQQVFAVDWRFTSGEVLEGTAWFPEIPEGDGVVARVLTDGPDADLDVASWVLVGALSVARRRVRIATPYFLPEEELETILRATALRGVQVELVLPERSNLPYLDWAARSELGDLIDKGVEVWLVPPPFDHSKLLVIDDGWVLLGSTNWDARSLRLNFELNLEVYDRELAGQVAAEIDARRSRGRRLTREEIDARSLPIVVRDRAIWVMKPYL